MCRARVTHGHCGDGGPGQRDRLVAGRRIGLGIGPHVQDDAEVRAIHHHLGVGGGGLGDGPAGDRDRLPERPCVLVPRVRLEQHEPQIAEEHGVFGMPGCADGLPGRHERLVQRFGVLGQLVRQPQDVPEVVEAHGPVERPVERPRDRHTEQLDSPAQQRKMTAALVGPAHHEAEFEGLFRGHALVLTGREYAVQQLRYGLGIDLVHRGQEAHGLDQSFVLRRPDRQRGEPDPVVHAQCVARLGVRRGVPVRGQTGGRTYRIVREQLTGVVPLHGCPDTPPKVAEQIPTGHPVPRSGWQSLRSPILPGAPATGWYIHKFAGKQVS